MVSNGNPVLPISFLLPGVPRIERLVFLRTTAATTRSFNSDLTIVGRLR